MNIEDSHDQVMNLEQSIIPSTTRKRNNRDIQRTSYGRRQLSVPRTLPDNISIISPEKFKNMSGDNDMIKYGSSNGNTFNYKKHLTSIPGAVKYTK